MSNQTQREEQSIPGQQATPTSGESQGAATSGMRTQLRSVDFAAGADMLRPRDPVQKKGGPSAPAGDKTAPASELGGGAAGGPAGAAEQSGAPGGAADQAGAPGGAAEQSGAPGGAAEQAGGAPAAENEVAGALTNLAEQGANEAAPGGAAQDSAAPGGAAAQEAGAPGAAAEEATAPADPGNQVAPLANAAPVAEVGGPEVDAQAGADAAPTEEVAKGGGGEGGGAGGEAPAGPEGGGGEAPAGGGEAGGASAQTMPAAQPIVAPAVSGGFVARQIPPLFAAMPAALEAHNVAGVIGTDPQTGATIFTGSINASAAEEQPEQEAVPVSQGAAQGVADQQAAESNAKLGEFLAAGAARVLRVQAEQAAIAPAIEAERAALVANVEAAAASAQATIEGAFGAALSLVETEAAGALAAADSSYAQTVGAIDAKLAASRATIEADNQAAIARLGEMRTTFATDIAGAFTAGSARFTSAGTSYSATATQAAQARASAYGAQALPAQGVLSRTFEGGDYELNKRNARVSAAQQVGTAYQAEYTKKATDAAAGLGNAAPSVVEGANAHINTVSDAIGSNQTNTLTALEQAATAAKEAAASARDAIKANVESSKSGNISQLESARGQAQAAIVGQSGQSVAAINESADTMRVGLEAGYTQLGQSLSDIVAEAEQAVGAEPPPPDELAVMLERSSVAMDAAEQGLRDTVNAQRDAGFGHLREVGATAAASLTEAGAVAAQQAATVGQSFASAMGNLKGELQRMLSEQQTQFETGADTSVTGHKAGCDSAIGALEGELATAQANVQSNIDGYVADLEGDFTTMHAGMDATITSEAQKAADKVQPRWAKVLTFVVKVIIAIVVAVAIAALCASGVGIGLILLGGALIGAAGAVASYLVDVASGQAEFSWSQMGIEAVKGAIGGLITAATGGIGSAATGSFLQQGAAAFFTSGITNTAAQFAAKAGINIGINMASGYLQQLGSNVFDSKVPWSQVFTAGQYDQFVGNLGPSIIAGVAGTYSFKDSGLIGRISGATGASNKMLETGYAASAEAIGQGTKVDMADPNQGVRDSATTTARRDAGAAPNVSSPMAFDPT